MIKPAMNAACSVFIVAIDDKDRKSYEKQDWGDDRKPKLKWHEERRSDFSALIDKLHSLEIITI